MSSSEEAEFDDDLPLSKIRRKNGTDKPDAVRSSSTINGNRSTSRKSRSNGISYNEDDDDESPSIKRERDLSDSEEEFQPKRNKKRNGRNGREEDSDDETEQPRRKKKRTKIKTESANTNGNGARRRAAAPAAPVAPAAAGSPTRRRTPATPASARTRTKALKKLGKVERIAHSMQSFLWWDAPDPPEGCQWSTMEHSGVSFTENYEPHGVKLKYDGKDVDLSPVEEEAYVVILFYSYNALLAVNIRLSSLHLPSCHFHNRATHFAGMDPEGMHLGNPKTAKIFIKNYFADFKSILDKKHDIKDFKKCDFEPIRRHLNEQKLIKKAITDEQRKLNKADRNQAMLKFGYALVDGHIEKVGNYNMEPPGTFRGRGEHPKMGKLKNRVNPEQVKLNVSACAPVPKCNVPGHAWGELRHDPQVQWLCQWTENINNQSKYMQLAAQSSFKGKSDRSKYSKAALLCDNIDKIRASCRKKLKSKDMGERQLATAMWVIDRLALRVGGEKDTEEEADTVGCCSLRVEHLHVDPNNDENVNEIELEFLGKDSMLFKQTINFSAEMYNANQGMGEQVYKNLKAFVKGKESSEEVFNLLTPTILNNHFKEIMDGLSAKVFRTYNASKTLQDELRKAEQADNWSQLNVAEKVTEYNNANRQVAILCNHQKTVSRAQETALETISGKISTLKSQKKILKKILKALNDGKDTNIPTKKDEKKFIDKVNKAIENAKKMKNKAKSNEEKIAATAADEDAKTLKKELSEMKFKQAHLWDKVPSIDQVTKKIQNWTTKISKAEMNLKHKDDNKEVSLGTSKVSCLCLV